ncbi:MAG: YraN family protein [Weeksellaceae bacterium]|nr:YraN family protein [Weeksellaceae bacterium]
MAEHNDFGQLAEELAKAFLKDKGYGIIRSNFRYQKAEIDIIASFADLVIMVEVKARASDAFFEPHEAVNKKKMRLIVTAADEFMKQENRNEEVRFDIISVLPDATGKLEITHIESAFEAMDAN